MSVVLQRLWTDGCPLCGEKHTPRFHCFAPRSYRKDLAELGDQTDTDAKILTQVPRILCEPSRQIRKQTGQPKQYTLTVLPGFLIPHSRVPVQQVHRALDGYVRQPELQQVGAALRMNCLSPASFRLFFSRARERLGSWTLALTQWILALGGMVAEADPGTPRQEGLAAQWGWFVRLSGEYARVYGRLPRGQVVPGRDLPLYLYAALSRHHRALGP